MNSIKTAKVNLDADEASSNEDGYLIFDGSPSDDRSAPVHRIDNDEKMGLERAKSKTAAIKTLRQHGLRSPDVKLERWKFPDRITNDFHEGKVWVMMPKQGGTHKKKAKASKKQKRKPVKRSRKR